MVAHPSCMGGLAVWGERAVEHCSTTAESETASAPDDLPRQGFHQEPATFYIGNFCAANHRVAHALGAQLVVPRRGAGERIAVTLRTDVFRECKARHMSFGPSPHCVYDVVNRAAARFLSTVTFRVSQLVDVIPMD